MVMGHAVDQQLLDLVQQSLELFQKEFAALQETVEEHEQRLDEMSAQQAEQARQVDKALAQLRDENYNRMLEMFESFRIQLKQGKLQVFCYTAFNLTLSPSGGGAAGERRSGVTCLLNKCYAKKMESIDIFV